MVIEIHTGTMSQGMNLEHSSSARFMSRFKSKGNQIEFHFPETNPETIRLLELFKRISRIKIKCHYNYPYTINPTKYDLHQRLTLKLLEIEKLLKARGCSL